MKRALVLLSTFNGDQFFPEFLGSLERCRAASGVQIDLFIRDDGSDDSFRSKLTLAVERLPWAKVHFGKNLGAAASYLELLYSCDRDYDYYLLADQDDVWLPTKVTAAMAKLDDANADIYASRCSLVDKNLNLIGTSISPRYISKHNALFENILTGCTICFRRSVLVELTSAPRPNKVTMHDAWIYLYAAFLGKVVFDRDSHILYRQHDSNVVGVENGFWTRVLRFVRDRWVKKKKVGGFVAQAIEFRKCFAASLSPADIRLIEEFTSACSGGLSALRYIKHCFPRSNYGAGVEALLAAKMFLGISR